MLYVPQEGDAPAGSSQRDAEALRPGGQAARVEHGHEQAQCDQIESVQVDHDAGFHESMPCQGYLNAIGTTGGATPNKLSTLP